MYLSYDELSDLQKESVSQEQFNMYIIKAQDIVDHVTSHFWKFKDFDNSNEFLVKQTKKAVYSQLEHFAKQDGSTLADFQVPASFSAGRTSITNSTRHQSTDVDLTSLISPEIYMHLESTGLLYRGVNPYYRGDGWDWL